MEEAKNAEPLVVIEEMKLKRQKRKVWSAKYDVQDDIEERRERRRRKHEAGRLEELNEEERKKEQELQDLLGQDKRKTAADEKAVKDAEREEKRAEKEA